MDEVASMHIKTFKDIVVWQRMHKLVLFVYKVTRLFPNEELFGLQSQLRRCSVSVASNFVEGYNRATTRDRLHFYTMSNASLEELKYQILLAKDLGYINEKYYNDVMTLADEVGRRLFKWKSIES